MLCAVAQAGGVSCKNNPAPPAPMGPSPRHFPLRSVVERHVLREAGPKGGRFPVRRCTSAIVLELSCGTAAGSAAWSAASAFAATHGSIQILAGSAVSPAAPICSGLVLRTRRRGSLLGAHYKLVTTNFGSRPPWQRSRVTFSHPTKREFSRTGRGPSEGVQKLNSIREEAGPRGVDRPEALSTPTGPASARLPRLQ